MPVLWCGTRGESLIGKCGVLPKVNKTFLSTFNADFNRISSVLEFKILRHRVFASSLSYYFQISFPDTTFK